MAKVLFSAETIRERVTELGRRITADYAGRTIDVVCLVNGASAFCADLVRHIDVPVRQHFLGFASYPTPSKSGEVRITLDVAEPLQDREVLVVEGVVVSGRTPKYVLDMLAVRRPLTLALCALAVKPAQLAVDLPIKYVAFEMGSEIAVGYGVGSGTYRTLPSLIQAE